MQSNRIPSQYVNPRGAKPFNASTNMFDNILRTKTSSICVTHLGNYFLTINFACYDNGHWKLSIHMFGKHSRPNDAWKHPPMRAGLGKLGLGASIW